MSVRYPVPLAPSRQPPAPQIMRVVFLPEAPVVENPLPPLVLAPLAPPGWPRMS
jgi:hypothetical protein